MSCQSQLAVQALYDRTDSSRLAGLVLTASAMQELYAQKGSYQYLVLLVLLLMLEQIVSSELCLYRSQTRQRDSMSPVSQAARILMT